MNQVMEWMKIHIKEEGVAKAVLTSIKSHCMTSSGRMPKDSGPHSFNKEWQM